MSINSASLSFGCSVVGAFLAAKGIKNCYKGQTNLGQYHIFLGAIALVGGAFLSITRNQELNSQNYDLFSQHDSSLCQSSTLDQIQNACENVLTKGYKHIPSMDLTKHIASVGPNFSDGQGYLRCDVELSREGHALFNQHGLENLKHMFKAALPNGCSVHGVIRHY